MNLNGYGKKWSWPNLMYCLGIYLVGLRKTTKYLSQYSQPLGQYLNTGIRIYEERLRKTMTSLSPDK
jgi:hypothetical protein